jgi:hypothetical protein
MIGSASASGPRAGALGQHGRRQARDPVLSRGIVGRSRHDDQVHLCDRNFVQLDDPDGQSVRQLTLLDLRELEGGRGSERGRLGAIRRLGRYTDGRDDNGQTPKNCFHKNSATKNTKAFPGKDDRLRGLRAFVA